MTAGYSGTPLARKLGVKPGVTVVALGAPEGYPDLLAPLPEGATIAGALPASAAFVHFFTRERAELEAELPRLKSALAKDGILWVSWPKKAAKVETDLTGDVVRAAVLATTLVDVKVCAISDIWSGLKVVWRKENR